MPERRTLRKAMTHSEDIWFAEGLRFTCTGCGSCCTGASGSVRLSDNDIDRLAKHLRLQPGRFVRQYTRTVRGERRPIDAPGSSECIFLRSKACSVYEARPTQCRTFPWWRENLRDEESWREAASSCEGIDHPAAPLILADEIMEQLRLDESNEGR
jgi:Fe-S-cluster containining protein